MCTQRPNQDGFDELQSGSTAASQVGDSKHLAMTLYYDFTPQVMTYHCECRVITWTSLQMNKLHLNSLTTRTHTCSFSARDTSNTRITTGATTAVDRQRKKTHGSRLPVLHCTVSTVTAAAAAAAKACKFLSMHWPATPPRVLPPSPTWVSCSLLLFLNINASFIKACQRT